MVEVTSKIGTNDFKVEISTRDHNLISDEPQDKGGMDSGMTPQELLATSLAACTSITLRIYLNHKGWQVDEILLRVLVIWEPDRKDTIINILLDYKGSLEQDQRDRLLKVANSCTVHKILTNPVTINTYFEEIG